MLLAPVILVASGCASARLPAIDPSGQRILLPNPNFTTFADDGPLSRLLHRNTAPASVASDQPSVFDGRGHDNSLFGGQHRVPSLLGIEPAFAGPPSPPPCTAAGAAPADAPCYPIGSPSPSSLSATFPGGAIGSGIATNGGPSATSPYLSPPTSGVFVRPARLVAPVGREVVLVGGIRTPGGALRPGQRVQWSLSQDSAGTIVDAGGQNSLPRRFINAVGGRRRGFGSQVESRTAKYCDFLGRSPLDPSDDVYLSRGETWVSVTSGSEGISYVTLAAPQLRDGSRRQQTASIIWVDGQWAFPPAAASSLEGPAQLVTYVRRQSDGQPIPNWIVRYSVLGGPAADLDLGGTQTLDVPTDAQGRAIVNVYPRTAQQGTTIVGLQIIKPRASAGEPPQILIGEGQTTVTWSESVIAIPPAEAPTLPPTESPEQPSSEPPVGADPDPPVLPQDTELSISIQGPERAQVGEDISYRVTVTNEGSSTAHGVVVDSLPAFGFQFRGSVPGPVVGSQPPSWNLGNLLPGARAIIDLRLAAVDGGQTRINLTARAANAEARRGGTDVSINGLAVSVSLAPTQQASVQVGETVDLVVTVQNLGSGPLRNIQLIAKDWGTGLRPVTVLNQQADPLKGIQFPAFELPPDGRRTIDLRFEALAEGTHGPVIQVSTGSSLATAEGFIRVVEASRPTIKIVDVRGRESLEVGTQGTYLVFVENTGNTELTGTRLEYMYEIDGDLTVVQASEGNTASSPDQRSVVLTWNFPPIAPGQHVTVAVEAEARRTPLRAQACHVIRVRTNEGATDEQQFCVNIVRPSDPAPTNPLDGGAGFYQRHHRFQQAAMSTGTLRARIQSRSLRARVNERIEYLVTVRNDSTRRYRDVVVALRVSDGVRFTGRASGPPNTRASVGQHGLVTTFSPIREIRPGEELTYRVQVAQKRAGEAAIVAQIDAFGLPGARRRKCLH